MVLHIDSGMLNLVTLQAKRRIAGFFHLNNKTYLLTSPASCNGCILVECKTLKHIVVSFAEMKQL